MNGIYSASDYDINTLKQGRSSKDTKKLTLSWMRIFNNRKITHSYTAETHTYQTEDLNLTWEKFYAELHKANGTDYEPARLRVMMSSFDR